MDKELYGKINKASNTNIKAYILYVSMKNWLNFEDWDGFANLFNKQSQYNLKDSEKISVFLKELGQKTSIEEIEKPKDDFEDIEDILKLYYNEEVNLLNVYSDIVKYSREQKDYKVEIFFNKMLAKQNKILSYIEPLIVRIERINGNMDGMYIFNNELRNF